MAKSPIVGLDHIGILVRDIDAAMPYYRDHLGLQLVADDYAEEVAARLVYFDAGNSMVQLVSPTGPGPIADALAEHGEGLHHVCFQVDEMQQGIEAISPGASPKVIKGGRNRLATFLPDRPNGLVMELTEVDEIAE